MMLGSMRGEGGQSGLARGPHSAHDNPHVAACQRDTSCWHDAQTLRTNTTHTSARRQELWKEHAAGT